MKIYFFPLLFVIVTSASSAQTSNKEQAEVYLRNLVNELNLDTMLVSKYSIKQEDSLVASEGFIGFPARLRKELTLLAVRDYFLGRYDHLSVFAKEIKSNSTQDDNLRNYLLLCAYANTNDPIKFGMIWDQCNRLKEENLMSAVRAHAVSENKNIDQLLVIYEKRKRNERNFNLSGLGILASGPLALVVIAIYRTVTGKGNIM